MLVDETFHQSGPGRYHLSRVYHHGGYILRVRVDRDYFPALSVAVVEVLTPQLTWTVLASSSYLDWHSGTPHESVDGAPLSTLAEQLLARGRAILPTVGARRNHQDDRAMPET